MNKVKNEPIVICSKEDYTPMHFGSVSLASKNIHVGEKFINKSLTLQMACGGYLICYKNDFIKAHLPEYWDNYKFHIESKILQKIILENDIIQTNIAMLTSIKNPIISQIVTGKRYLLSIREMIKITNAINFLLKKKGLDSILMQDLFPKYIKEHSKKLPKYNREIKSSIINNDLLDIIEITNRHIIEMCSSIISACIQKGTKSVNICDIRKFFGDEKIFDIVWDKVKPYVTTHLFKGSLIEEYSISLKRKLFDDTILYGVDVQECIKKSDF